MIYHIRDKVALIRKTPLLNLNKKGAKKMNICDMIQGNESDVEDVVFEILAKTVLKFLCIILF